MKFINPLHTKFLQSDDMVIYCVKGGYANVVPDAGVNVFYGRFAPKLYIVYNEVEVCNNIPLRDYCTVFKGGGLCHHYLC